MQKNKLIGGLFASLLLASPLAGAESQYPESFEPTVIYQDTDYIAKHAQQVEAAQPASASAVPTPAAPVAAVPVAASAPSAPVASAPTPAASTAAPALGKSDDSLTGAGPIGLVVLGMAGFIFWSCRSECRKSAKPETGVAKYLRKVAAEEAARKNETGVAKYLRLHGL
jgi:hypothetical protein